MDRATRQAASNASGRQPSYCKFNGKHRKRLIHLCSYKFHKDYSRRFSPRPGFPPTQQTRTRPRVYSASILHEVQQVISRPNIFDSEGRLCVKSLTLPELQRWFVEQGERPSRADQLWRWVYGNGSTATASRRLAAASTHDSAPAGASINGSSFSSSNHRYENAIRVFSVPEPAVGSSGAKARHKAATTMTATVTAAAAAVASGNDNEDDDDSGSFGNDDARQYFGGGLRQLGEAVEPAVNSFSRTFIRRFSSQLSLDGGLRLEEVAAAEDGTRKLVFRVTAGEAAGGRIETVLIPWYRDYDPRVGRQEQPRYTLCVSSQVGCAMNCQFCFTGRRGLLGNLSTAQIIEQVLVAQQVLDHEAQSASTSTRGCRARDRDRGRGTSSLEAQVPSSSLEVGRPDGSHRADEPYGALPGSVSPSSPLSYPAASPSPPPLAAAPITNIVFMGMGEPLHNCPAVFAALDILTHRRGLGMSASRITLSTVGLLPQLQHFLDRYGPPPAARHITSTSSSYSSFTSTNPRVSLAVSIHAGTNELRAAIVPSNSRLLLNSSTTAPPSPRRTMTASGCESTTKLVASTRSAVAGIAEDVESKWVEAATAGGGGDGTGDGGGDGSLRGLAALCAVLARHYPRTDRRPLKAGRYVLFEYTLLGGVNDRTEDAAALLEATREIECSFNLIMFNPFPGTLYEPSTSERVWEFQRVLRSAGRIVHVRRSKGDSEMAACGQLGDVGPGGKGRMGPKVLPEAAALAAAAAAAAKVTNNRSTATDAATDATTIVVPVAAS